MVLDHQDEYPSRWQAIQSTATKVDVHYTTLSGWVKRHEIYNGQRPGLTTDEREQLKKLELENKELRRANEILKSASAFFAAGFDGRPQQVVRYVTANRESHGVEPICKVLQVAPQTYYSAARRPPSVRELHDGHLKEAIEFVWVQNPGVYGAAKAWAMLRSEDIRVARCTVERLMRDLGFRGVVRGKTVRTTIGDEAANRLRTWWIGILSPLHRTIYGLQI